MDIKLKQRLIGAIVILALVVIFVPMLFREHKSLDSDILVTTPPAPDQPILSQKTQVTENDQMQTVQPGLSSEASMQTDKLETKPLDVQKQQTPDMQTSNSIIKNEQANIKKHINEDIAVTKQKPHTDKHVVKQDVNQSEIKKPIESDSLFLKQIKKYNIRKSNVTSKNVAESIGSKDQQKSVITAKSQNNAYVVQLGVFVNSDNADKLIHKLREHGFTVFGYKLMVRDKIYTHVYVGPSVTLEKAKILAQKLHQQMNLQGIVVKFDASKLY